MVRRVNRDEESQRRAEGTDLAEAGGAQGAKDTGSGGTAAGAEPSEISDREQGSVRGSGKSKNRT